jgi:hypothetical protein
MGGASRRDLFHNLKILKISNLGSGSRGSAGARYKKYISAKEGGQEWLDWKSRGSEWAT